MFFTPLLQGAAQQQAGAAGPAAFYIPPKRWSRQPQGPVQIDWSNPINKDLGDVMLPHLKRSLVNQYPAVIGSGVRTDGVGLGGRGSYAVTPTNPNIDYTGSRVDPAGDLTALMVMLPRVAVASIQMAGVGSIGAVANGGFAFYASASTQRVRCFNTVNSDITATVGDRIINLDELSVQLVKINNTTKTATLFMNGTKTSASDVSVPNYIPSTTDFFRIGPTIAGTPTGPYTLIHMAAIWHRQLTDSECLSITANPWQIFQPTQALVGAAVSAPSITITRPNSDIVVAGWVGVPDNLNLYANIDEAVPSTTDYILSPDVGSSPGPAIFGLSNILSTGSYDVRFEAKRTQSTGQIRVVLRDSGGVSVGSSAWQTLTNAYTTYALTVSTTGTATQGGFEVQP